MRLRTIGLLLTLALVLLTAPLAAQAQQPAKVPRIGFLAQAMVSPCRNDLFAQGLRELGYVEGHTIVIEWRCAAGMPERARELAAELVQLPVDVFVARAADGPLAAMQGFAQDTCNLVPQSHSSKKVNLFGQHIATLLAL